VERKITISAGVAQGNLTHKIDPPYPPEAQSKGIHGMVTIHASIGKDGHVSNLQVVQGPDELRQAALDAVQQWTYRPYQLNGEVVSVDTMINVEFRLSR
jgi:protein TonB